MPGRILLVDDSQLVRVTLAQHLVAAGFQVDEAESGAIALERLSHGSYDVVITDLRMPGLDAFEVLAAAKQVAGGVEVIVLTGAHGDDMSAAMRALRLGAHDYLVKPPQSADDVVLTVARAMEKRRLRETNRQLLQRLEALALTDALTGVPNRRSFDQAFEQEIARARRYGEPLGVIALDIDHFKRVNDTCGHEGGDEVLRSFTQTVKGVLRKGDSFYRRGGEEFAVILPFAEYAGVLAVGERIVAAVARSPVRAGPLTVPITTSAGAACLEPGDDGRQLISRADAALGQAKSGGRNRVCLNNSRQHSGGVFEGGAVQGNHPDGLPRTK
jgi:two-component system cell cycle response regulator